MHYPVLPLVAFPGPCCRREGGGCPPSPGDFSRPRKEERNQPEEGGRAEEKFCHRVTYCSCAGEGKTKFGPAGGGGRRGKKKVFYFECRAKTVLQP